MSFIFASVTNLFLTISAVSTAHMASF